MTKFAQIALLSTLCFALMSCGKFQQRYQDVQMSSVQEKSCGFIQNSKGYRISWRSTIPVIFYFEKSFPEDMKIGVQRAADRWNTLSGKSLISISTEIIESLKPTADGKNVIYWVINGSGFVPNEQAKTSIRWNGNELTDADIQLNKKYWNFYIDEPADLYSIHLESLMVHELGHAMGLVHQTIFESVMYPTLRTNFVRDVPMPKPDLEGLGCEYL